MRWHVPLGDFASGKYEQNLGSFENTERNEVEGFAIRYSGVAGLYGKGLVQNKTQEPITQRDDGSENDGGEERQNDDLSERISACD